MNTWEHSLFFRALHCLPTPRRPIWLMRQAGRYLPEYRAIRQSAGGFLPMINNPQIACEITLQPIRRFGLDAAIIFSDILTVPDAMGLGLHFIESEGPKLRHPITDENAVQQLRRPDPSSYQYVAEACRLTREALPPDIPLIGFCGSPWTLACYMIDGEGGKEFWRARQMLYTRPDLLHQLLTLNAEACADLLIMQINNGAQVAMIFDSWGGLLGAPHYEDFSLAYMRRIISRIKQHNDNTPVIVFARQCGYQLPNMLTCGCDAIGVDWQVPLSAARRMAAGKIAIQGNMDPAALLTSPAIAAAVAHQTLEDYGKTPGHIFNLGHGINKNTPPDNVAAIVETAHNWSCDADNAN